MSPTYLYCITAPEAPGPPPTLVGLDGGDVRGLGPAWVSDVSARPVRATVDRIRAHDAVVGAALGTGVTPVPARFGQVFESDDECSRAIRARQGDLSAALARVAGMVEMTVLLRGSAPSPDRTSGTAYLASLGLRARAEDDLRRASRSVNEQLRGCVREAVDSVSGGVATLSHLVEREALTRYRASVTAVTDGLTGVQVTIVGPTAPYSFGRTE